MVRRHAAVAALAIGSLAACSSDQPMPLGPSAAAFSAGEAEDAGTYLVRFKGNGVPSDFASTVASLGGEVIFAHGGAGIAAVSGLSNAAADQLAGVSSIAAVDADAYTELPEPDMASLEALDAAPESQSNPTTARFYPRQWNMRAIQANDAWAAGKLGSEAVKVGILDTGIDYLHPDLKGLVDLELSKSFLSRAENARVSATFGPGTHEIADLNYHGTHVAATVASNAILAAGVTSKTTLVGLKVCAPGVAPSFRGTCPTSGTLAAILYATDNNIPIINLSLGGSFNRRAASARGGDGPSFLATINQAVNYAYRGGTQMIVSAGNSAADLDHDGNSFKSYCSAPNVTCVSATGPTAAASLNGPWANVDALASYSNFGRSAISVAAPGGNRQSVTAACSGFTIVTGLLVCRNRNAETGRGFVLGISGTSMASPHAAGVAALIAAEGTTGPAQIRAKLQQTADDLGEAGVDPAYGKGRVNAARAAGVI